MSLRSDRNRSDRARRGPMSTVPALAPAAVEAATGAMEAMGAVLTVTEDGRTDSCPTEVPVPGLADRDVPADGLLALALAAFGRRPSEVLGHRLYVAADGRPEKLVIVTGDGQKLTYMVREAR